MRLGGRLAAAIEIIDDIARRHRPAADALKDWGLSHRFAGSGDRAAIGNIVYDALRRKRSAGWIMGGEDGRAIAFGALLLEWGMTPAGLNAALDGDRFAPAPLTADELAGLESRRLEDAPPAIRADIPDWCIPQFERAFGDAWVHEAQALSGRPPLDLRVNTLKSERERVLSELQGTGAEGVPPLPEAIRIPPIAGDGRHPNVQAEPAFQKGWFEVQDLGSQIAAKLAGARPGLQMLDYCAGAGGKTLALAAAAENSGQVFAHDSEKPRLAPIFDRLRRAGCHNVQVIANKAGLGPLEGQMDLVLIDAPCTGTGTWRRRPDAKWRLGERQLATRLAEQAAILDAASAYVKLGGRLAYVTCSVFAEENAEQLAAFVARRPEFAPVDHEALWAGEIGRDADSAWIDTTQGIRLAPGRSGTDGFYFGMLTRR